SLFVLGISALYLLKGRDLAFARRSFAVATGFGLASILSVIVLGDQSGFITGQVQKVKLAAMEAHWESDPTPSPFTLFGFPDQESQITRAAIKIPWLGSILVTRSLNEPVPGIKELIAEHDGRIRKGITAYGLLEKMRNGDRSAETARQFQSVQEDLGYGLLLKRYTPGVVDASEAQIRQAARDTIPNVSVMFWSFRLMVGLGFYFLFLIALAFYYCARRVFEQKRWLLKLLLVSLPLPWIAIWAGWIVAEYGRQPWSIGNVLPTFLSASSLTTADLIGSLIGLTVLYTILLAAELYLMVKFVRIGPSSLHTGHYHFEQKTAMETTG
ncbi:MAG: cytochrome ubiquinol oxidase subunit I, partial [Desulfobacterales bacterium]